MAQLKPVSIEELRDIFGTVATNKLQSAILGDTNIIVGILKKTNIYDGEINVSNTGTAAATLNVLSNPVSIQYDGEYIIEIAIDTSTTAKLDVTVGTKTYSYYLNAGNALAANSWYAFSVFLKSGDSINISLDVAAGATITGLLRIFKS